MQASEGEGVGDPRITTNPALETAATPAPVPVAALPPGETALPLTGDGSPGASPAPRYDGLREIGETVAIVTLIWLLVKLFVAEPFVIPSSSMAGTLYGFQKTITCAVCGKPFAVDCGSEKEPKEGRFTKTTSCKCQNCELPMDLEQRVIDSSPSSGDRVLVLKFPEDLGLSQLDRLDVVVFRCPEELQRNFIKRLIGLPGDTVAIHRGDIYISKTYQPPEGKADLSRPMRHKWRKETREYDKVAKYLSENGFEILRKPPDKILSMRWLVYDNDYPPPDLPARWESVGPASSWQGEDLLAAATTTGANDTGADPGLPRRFRHTSGSKDVSWLRYQHHVRNHARLTQLIRDLISYNSNDLDRGGGGGNWVGDLLMECEVTVEQPQGEFIMELRKGHDRFRATWDFATGECVLSRNGSPQPLARAATGFKTGTRRLRFANVDQRLTVWVDNKLPFGDGITYAPSRDSGPSWNDLEPARLGARGVDLTVKHLSLWRDTYYTMSSSGADATRIDSHHWSNPDEANPLRQLGVVAFYVQPGHYFCLGDNSPHSLDSRCWDRIGDVEKGGLVPKNLMLGRAVGIFYPFSRFGLIR